MSKEKHLKQGEKISNIENASFNLILIPLTICKRILKRVSKRICKTKLVVQAWSKILNKKKTIHAYLVETIIGFIPCNLCTYLMQTSSILHSCICFGLCWHQSPKRGRLKGK
jgi:sulfite exporter TauE/SafE